VNNSSPIGGENYENLKTQCTVKMAQRIQQRGAGESCTTDNDLIEQIREEMEQIKMRDMDKDGKVKVQPKEHIKEMIGRSPDDWDSIMMRYYFELNPHDGKYFIA
jgi:hypothetical protein